MGALVATQVGLEELDAAWNPFQSRYWAVVKKSSGWSSRAFRLSGGAQEGGESWTAVVLVLVRRLAAGISIAYVPFGPPSDLIGGNAAFLLREFSRSVKPYVPKGTMFIRFDLPWGEPDDERIFAISGRGLHTCRESVQPEATARIDLSEGYTIVRSRYRERAKRNIRKAESKGITVESWDGTDASFDRWYDVYLETAGRDGFTARPAGYLRTFLHASGDDVDCRLYIAKSGEQILGGAIILESRCLALYLYGASLRVEGCSPSYLLQNHAIREACGRGRRIYDLYGISGPGQRGAHLEGLRLFKRSFGGYVCYRPPSVDYAYHRFPRSCYLIFEHMRYRAHRKKHPGRMSQQYAVSKEN